MQYMLGDELKIKIVTEMKTLGFQNPSILMS